MSNLHDSEQPTLENHELDTFNNREQQNHEQPILKECEFVSVGCHFKGNEEEMSTHYNIEMVNHLKRVETVTLVTRAKQSVLTGKIEKLIAENTQLKKNINVLKHEINKLQTQSNDVKNKEEENSNLLKQHEKQLTITDLRFVDMDLKISLLQTASYDGVLMWKLCDYSRRKHEAINKKTVSLYSQPFYTSLHGYKLCARTFLNGDGVGIGTHVSLFIVIMKGEYDILLKWPFDHTIKFSVVNQNGGEDVTHIFRPDITSRSFIRPENEMNIAMGCPMMIERSKLETREFLKDDVIFLKAEVMMNENTS